MQITILRRLLLLTLLFTGSAKADVTAEDFVAKTTQNLLNLCTASPEDKQYREAIHFCQGYLVGAYQYYAAASTNNPTLQLVCFPEPKPSRNDAIDQFISWAQKHPEYMNENPVETEFRFLSEKWPCNKS
jgi:hypothetical protein